MPLIEELPVSATNVRPSHGWAYIADTNTSVPAVQLGSRKRGRDGNAAATAQAAHKLSAKQEKAIQQRLHDLGKENFREANIPIPKREGGGGRSHDRDPRKTTQNVRRILAYSRTFQHYLADEEAGVNVYGAAAIAAAAAAASAATTTGGTPNHTSKTGDSRRRAAAAGPTEQKAATPRRTTSTSKKAAARATVKSESESDVAMTDAVAAPPPLQSKPEPAAAAAAAAAPAAVAESAESSHQAIPKPIQGQTKSQHDVLESTYDPALDKDPLLRTRDLPKMPSDRVMQALLAEPPLSYTAARAKPLEGGVAGSNVLVARPPRWFCAVCGYWGKVRCKRGCGERVCGLLECWKGHEGVCSLAAY